MAETVVRFSKKVSPAPQSVRSFNGTWFARFRNALGFPSNAGSNTSNSVKGVKRTTEVRSGDAARDAARKNVAVGSATEAVHTHMRSQVNIEEIPSPSPDPSLTSPQHFQQVPTANSSSDSTSRTTTTTAPVDKRTMFSMSKEEEQVLEVDRMLDANSPAAESFFRRMYTVSGWKNVVFFVAFGSLGVIALPTAYVALKWKYKDYVLPNAFGLTDEYVLDRKTGKPVRCDWCAPPPMTRGTPPPPPKSKSGEGGGPPVPDHPHRSGASSSGNQSEGPTSWIAGGRVKYSE